MPDRYPRNLFQENINHASVLWLATVGARGLPSIAPKEAFVADERRVVFADKRAVSCVANIAANPAVNMAFFDPIHRCGHRLDATARVLGRDDGDFPEFEQQLLERYAPDLPFEVIVEASVRHHDAVPVSLLRLHPRRTRRDMLEQRRATLNAWLT